MVSIPKLPAEVQAAIRAYTPNQQSKLLELRRFIFETAAITDGVGNLTETLKWGQPSYLTDETKSGSTIRIDRVKGSDKQIALYVHCQTSLISQFKDYYGDKLCYDGKRAVVFDANENLPEMALRHCIALAMTYHLNKK
jgi:hypothetical protein